MRFILGPIVIIIGILMMKYTVAITNVTGQVGFAEKYLRPGGAGTYTWWRLVGLGLIVISILWMSGRFNVWFTTTPTLLNH
jgi:hypothetical protein